MRNYIEKMRGVKRKRKCDYEMVKQTANQGYIFRNGNYFNRIYKFIKGPHGGITFFAIAVIIQLDGRLSAVVH